tara:strand:+ start:29188 stop:29757 length:570 start_codon:yes stop_codon:yes gene_type:complete
MILLLGMPKSGTSSFNELFKKLGYKSYHWKKGKQYIGKLIETNKKNKKPLLCDFLDTDVITQMDICINKNNCYWPQIVDYKQIINENPDAIFILNKRNPEELLSSFKRWDNLLGRLFTYNSEIITNKTDKGFIEFVNKFYFEIELYFKENPNLKFISYDINNDKVEKLKKYIAIPKNCTFEKVNVNNKK